MIPGLSDKLKQITEGSAALMEKINDFNTKFDTIIEQNNTLIEQNETMVSLLEEIAGHDVLEK